MISHNERKSELLFKKRKVDMSDGEVEEKLFSCGFFGRTLGDHSSLIETI
jgi:hypothetical protein